MLRLRDIMTTDVVTVSPDATLREAAELLAGHHLSGMPVTAGSKVVGVVTASDLLTFDATRPPVPTERTEDVDWGDALEPGVEEDAEREEVPPASYYTELWDDAGADVVARMDSAGGPEWNVLDEHAVAEVMTRSIHAMTPDQPVEAAADLMRRMAVHRVLVMEGEQVRGIVTTTDIAGAVADHKLQVRTYVFPGARPW
ncbi:MAG TPA: CBS domain-containing protein [Gemmatimonadaceae bacterium]